jgi:protease-4
MFSEAEASRLESQLQQFYREDFLKKVAVGRRMDEAEVDRVGRGRIWSGFRAKECGLIDLLGGPLEAIQEARRLARIPDKQKVRIVHYARRRRLAEIFIPELKPHLQYKLIPEPLRALLDLLEQAARSTILLLMPFEIRIR